MTREPVFGRKALIGALAALALATVAIMWWAG